MSASNCVSQVDLEARIDRILTFDGRLWSESGALAPVVDGTVGFAGDDDDGVNAGGCVGRCGVASWLAI